GNTKDGKIRWKVIGTFAVNTRCGHRVNEVAVEDSLPTSTMAYRSIPFAITVPNLEYFAIQSFMHESSTRHCGLLAIVLA
ncbi:MAG: hypothetical protein V3S16_15515, partial [Candidatus Desulfatibia sp.]|uniref:hypothetical protein n=1 Tax=Candidatus Desulfatibia sp. TaxID=3101189 RepID=UPI002F303B7F